MAVRVYLRVLVGREWRDRFLEKLWVSRNNYPQFGPAFLRRHLETWRMLSITRSKRVTDYEPTVSRFVASLHGELFVDVGANVGFYTWLLADNFARVIAVEADPAIFKYLERKAPKNCKLLNLAIADRDGTARLQRNPENLVGGASIMGNKGIEVPQRSLGALLSREPIVDLVKLDVEGAEWLVLEGAEDIMPNIRQWVIELHDRGRKAQLEEYMQRHGYTCKWLDQNRFPHGYFSRLEWKTSGKQDFE